jgi:hypothetical protein
LALPTGPRVSSIINSLEKGLGKPRCIRFQSVSGLLPKPFSAIEQHDTAPTVRTLGRVMTDAATDPLAYVHSYIDQRGKLRRVFRRRGQRKVTLHWRTRQP